MLTTPPGAPIGKTPYETPQSAKARECIMAGYEQLTAALHKAESRCIEKMESVIRGTIDPVDYAMLQILVWYISEMYGEEFSDVWDHYRREVFANIEIPYVDGPPLPKPDVHKLARMVKASRNPRPNRRIILFRHKMGG